MIKLNLKHSPLKENSLRSKKVLLKLFPTIKLVKSSLPEKLMEMDSSKQDNQIPMLLALMVIPKIQPFQLH